MIADYSRDLLRSGIIEMKAGDRDAARRYLDRALYMSSDHDVLAEAWYCMSELADDPADKRRALENCLIHDLRHARARRALAILDGKLKSDEVIDPDAAQTGIEDVQPADAQRFMCPKCGARMHFAPDGRALVCDYCTRAAPLGREAAPADKDFLLVMATARGHDRPLAEQVLLCQGCGARFILPPQLLSITCPYCGSPHVVSFEKAPDLLAPDGIIPHAFDQARATAILRDWLLKAGTASPSKAAHRTQSRLPQHQEATQFQRLRGMYLPLWTFDLGGAIDYTGEVVEQDTSLMGRRGVRVAHVSDSYPVMLLRLPIPASRKLSAPFVNLLPSFDLKQVQPYDPRYLADWPAELYDIPMAEASLDARSQGFAILKRDMVVRLAPVRLLSASSANLVIDSFRLNLVPIWMTEVENAAGLHVVLVNGQTGDVCGDLGNRPAHTGAVLSWLSDLIHE